MYFKKRNRNATKVTFILVLGAGKFGKKLSTADRGIMTSIANGASLQTIIL